MINDVYDLAVTAYALAKAGSARSFDAYAKLKANATTTKGNENIEECYL